MMIIEKALSKIGGYVTSIKRNTQDGRWELEVGLPKDWVFDESDVIGCKIVAESDLGKLLLIQPNDDTVVIDDLITFIELIIQTNKKIAEKEELFKQKMDEMRGMLEQEAKKFYTELDELKENSFRDINKSLNKESETKSEPTKRPRKPRTTKPKTQENTKKKETLLELDDVESNKD